MKLIIAYLIIVNLLALFTMAHDKSQAKKRGRRVPEKNLLLLAAIGGSIGGIVAMRVWRHKTKHASFSIGMPAILIVQTALAIWLLT
ncbi:DUF1294 domain-containing protein [Cohnella lupini]|uniref:DUF1294 domain-containing protein n=1 Tax=Cohnella lupini TaxID=1294267 RepID=UPI000E236C3F|nr:DUF1294 domain-containing protein [Cohnella lupini]